MKNVLITGGAGYVGSAAIPLLLDRGFNVRVLDSLLHGGQSLLGVWSHPGFEFVHGDIRERNDVRAAVRDIDAVVHLAGIVGDPACARQPDVARETNLDASLMLLSESQEAGVSRFVFASTCSNYGKVKDSSQYADETSDLRPVSLYAETKVAVEYNMLDPTTYKLMVTTPLRFATVFGVSPRMRFDLTVNEFTLEMLTKKHLVVFGEQFWRPYVHVRDVARAITLVLESPTDKVNRRVFNVGDTHQNYQKQQLVQLIQKHAPEAVIEYVHKDEDPRDYRVSFERISKELGFGITRTVEDGITEVARLVASNVIQDFDNARYRN